MCTWKMQKTDQQICLVSKKTKRELRRVQERKVRVGLIPWYPSGHLKRKVSLLLVSHIGTCGLLFCSSTYTQRLHYPGRLKALKDGECQAPPVVAWYSELARNSHRLHRVTTKCTNPSRQERMPPPFLLLISHEQEGIYGEFEPKNGSPMPIQMEVVFPPFFFFFLVPQDFSVIFSKTLRKQTVLQ